MPAEEDAAEPLGVLLLLLLLDADDDEEDDEAEGEGAGPAAVGLLLVFEEEGDAGYEEWGVLHLDSEDEEEDADDKAAHGNGGGPSPPGMSGIHAASCLLCNVTRSASVTGRWPTIRFVAPPGASATVTMTNCEVSQMGSSKVSFQLHIDGPHL